MKQYTIEYYISKNLQQRTNQIKREDSESYLYNYLIRKFIQSSPESFSCRCLLPNHVLNQSLISYTLCCHPLTHFELLNLDEQSETQQARVVQRRLERNISSFNFVLNFHFQPFFQLSFSYRYSFATKNEPLQCSTIQRSPPSCGQLSNSGNSNGTIHGCQQRCNFYSSV